MSTGDIRGLFESHRMSATCRDAFRIRERLCRRDDTKDTLRKDSVTRPRHEVYISRFPISQPSVPFRQTSLAQRLSIAQAHRVIRSAALQDCFTFAYEGEEMDEQKTIQENGICEPGPAARRAGARVELLSEPYRS